MNTIPNELEDTNGIYNHFVFLKFVIQVEYKFLNELEDTNGIYNRFVFLKLQNEIWQKLRLKGSTPSIQGFLSERYEHINILETLGTLFSVGARLTYLRNSCRVELYCELEKHTLCELSNMTIVQLILSVKLVKNFYSI